MRTFPACLILVLAAGCPEADSDSGTPCDVFSAPWPVDELNTVGTESGPEISADGLAIYFNRDTPVTGSEILMATRTSLDSAFGEPQAVEELNTGYAGESSPSLSSDGLTIYFYSDRAGGLGSGDIWVSTRTDVASPWGAPTNVAEVNSKDNDYGPSVSEDGLELFFTSDRAGGEGASDIWVARRTDTASPFGTPVDVAEVNDERMNEGVNVSHDGLSLYFTSYADYALSDILVATRPDAASPFGDPTPVAGVNRDGVQDSTPDISPDGLTMYFSRSLADRDIFVATRECL